MLFTLCLLLSGFHLPSAACPLHAAALVSVPVPLPGEGSTSSMVSLVAPLGACLLGSLLQSQPSLASPGPLAPRVCFGGRNEARSCGEAGVAGAQQGWCQHPAAGEEKWRWRQRLRGQRMPGAGGEQGWKRWQISAPGEGNAQQRRSFRWTQHLFFIATYLSCHLIPLAAQSSTVEMGLACFFPMCCPTSSEQGKDFHPVRADRAAPSGCETWAHTTRVQTVSG